MNRIKRILSMVLVCVMVLAIVPATTLTAFAEATGTTGLFNGNATYLLQERFASPASLDEENIVLSGWDVDYRGGTITGYHQPTAKYKDSENVEQTYYFEEDYPINSGALISDGNTFEKVSMSHQLMSHSFATGNLVMESTFMFKTIPDEGFYYEMSGNDKTALRIESVRKTPGQKPCYLVVNGTDTGIVCEMDKTYHIKAEFVGTKVTVYINGDNVGTFDYVNTTCTSIDKIEISTSEETIGNIVISNVFVYVNYTVNDSFLGTNASEWWDVVNGNVTQVPGAPYSADPNGFALNSLEAVEPSYVKDNAIIRIVEELDTDAALKAVRGGTTAKISVANEQEAATIGKTGALKVVTDGGNGGRVGIKIAENFAFQLGDVLEYSFSIYPTSDIYPNAAYDNLNFVLLRNHTDENGATSPLRNVSPGGITLKANQWNTLANSITFDDLTLTAGTAGVNWDTVGNYELYLRTQGTYYLDDIKVTIKRGDSTYYSNAATGEYININHTMDSVDNDVIITQNVSSPSYTAESGVFTGTFAANDAHSVVAVRLVNDSGVPVKTLNIGDIIDVTMDIHSSAKLSTPYSTATSGTAGIVLREGNIVPGSYGPGGANRQLGLITAPAGKWTKVHTSYELKEDLTVSENANWYVTMKPNQAATIKVDNIKITVRKPSAAVVPTIYEVDSPSDFTWFGADAGATVTTANGIGGRDNVIHAQNLDSNSANVGFLLGHNFTFKEGDVLSYSFDAYTTASGITPSVWLRNHGTSTDPFTQLYDVPISANTWTPITGTFTYDQIREKGEAFATTANRYAIYVRRSSAGDLYFDNFKVTIKNTNDESKYVTDLTDGSRFKASANKASDFTWGTANASYDATKDAVKLTLGTNDEAGAGVLFSKAFSFRQGDVLTYSVDVYTESSINPDIWLRDKVDNAPRVVFYHAAPTTGTWTTLTETITYEDLVAKAESQEKGQGTGWDVASDKWAMYFRPRAAGTMWVKNFTVKVARDGYAFPEPSNASLEKNFAKLSGNQTFSFDVLVPANGEGTANGFAAKFGGATFKIANDKFYLGSTEVYTPTKNVWYKIKIDVSGTTATLYVNGNEKGSASVSGEMTSVAFENTSGNQILIDNVQVAPTYDKSGYANYPTIDPDNVATAKNGLNIGMVSYPMWREGIHYGWDLISPYENREPVLGYYTGGSPEVADWNLKWWAEHGFDHVIYPFVRPDINDAGGQPSVSVRGEELHDGYMNAINNGYVDFAIMLSNPLQEQFTDSAEWIKNVLPYIIEHYFKNPNYKVIDNQLVVYNYNLDEFAALLSDGTEGLKNILRALESAAEGLVNPATGSNYSGVMFVADITSVDNDTFFDNFSGLTQSFYKWRYSWGSDVTNDIKDSITSEYDDNKKIVASIPMGYDTTPWLPSNVGIISDTDIKDICTTVSNISLDANDPKLILFTCWDEWGEGHFYSPSTATDSGFGYLNAVRETLTTKNEALASEGTPSPEAVKRMSVLYPEGRQILKIREDRKTDINADSFTKQLGTTFTPSSSNFKYGVETYVEKSWILGTYRDYEAWPSGGIFEVKEETQSAPSVIFTAPTDVDFTKVTAIVVNGYATSSSTMTIKLATGGESDVYKADFKNDDNTFRFEGQNIPSSEASNIILTPDNPKALAEATDKVTYLRVNLGTQTGVGTKFKINSIKFYEDDVAGMAVYVDNNKMNLVSTYKGSSDTTMIPAYKFLHDVGAKVTWDKDTRTLTASKNGTTAKFTANSTAVQVENGVPTTLSTEAKYDDGNLFIPYDGILAPFGYEEEVDTSTDTKTYNYYSKTFRDEYSKDDYRWDFNRDGDTEGWSLSSNSSVTTYIQGGYSASQDTETGVISTTRLEGGYAATVRDGVMKIRAANGDINLYSPKFSLPKEDAKYFSMVVDTDATAMYLRVYDDDTEEAPDLTSGGGLVYIVPIPDEKGPQRIVVDLEKDTHLIRNTENGFTGYDGYTYDALGTNITAIRLDPIYDAKYSAVTEGKIVGVINKTGTADIDHIQFTENYPVDLEMRAYAFGENKFNAKTANWTFMYNFVAEDGTCSGNNSGWGTSNKNPTIVATGEDADTLELKFGSTNTATEGQAGINYFKSGSSVLETVKDKIVKVSFWYKSEGAVDWIRFENRHKNSTIVFDGEQYTLYPTNEWQYFEGYLDMKKLYDTVGEELGGVTTGVGDRVYSIRVHRTSENAEAAAYIKDYQIRILDETTPDPMFTDGGVAIRVMTNDPANYKGTVHVGAFETVNNKTLLTNFNSGANAKDAYHIISPTSGTTEIRAYLWDGLNPLLQPLVLYRKKAN